MCPSFEILNSFGTFSSWESGKLQAIRAFPLYEVASHVKNCHFGDCYYYYYYYYYYYSGGRTLRCDLCSTLSRTVSPGRIWSDPKVALSSSSATPRDKLRCWSNGGTASRFMIWERHADKMADDTDHRSICYTGSRLRYPYWPNCDLGAAISNLICTRVYLKALLSRCAIYVIYWPKIMHVNNTAH